MQDAAINIISDIMTDRTITPGLTNFAAANTFIKKRRGTSKSRIMEDIPNTVETLSSKTLKGSKLIFDVKISLLKTK